MKYIFMGLVVTFALATFMFVMLSKAIFVELRERANKADLNRRH